MADDWAIRRAVTMHWSPRAFCGVLQCIPAGGATGVDKIHECDLSETGFRGRALAITPAGREP